MRTLQEVVLLLAATVAVVWIVAFLGFDADGDGAGDTVRMGPWTVQLVLLPAETEVAVREYELPPRYVHLIAGKAFGWDTGWNVEEQVDSSLTSEVRRKVDGVRLVVWIEGRPSGSAVVRMSTRHEDGREVLTEGFEILEGILWHRLPMPPARLWGPQG